MIELSNAIANPRTVMIHSNDTPIANGAVMDSFLLYHVTLEAITNFVQGFDFFKVYLAFYFVFPSLLLIFGFGSSIDFNFLDFLSIVHVLNRLKSTVR